MNTVPPQNLACPIDKLALIKKDSCYQCANGHSFDIAKQGYINLLPVQHKKSKDPGDSKTMVLARNRFLDAGFYQPIADALSDIVFNNLNNSQDQCVLDAGCGEGYYLNRIINQMQTQVSVSEIAFLGMDISKPAILAASKRNKQAGWVVGTNSQPPFLEKSIDLIFSVFGFHSFTGFKNVLKPEGKVILVEPGEQHLQELRAIIYSEPASEKNKTESNSEYELLHTQTLKFEIQINSNEQILYLLSMTPHLFRANSEGKANIESMDSISLTIDIIFSTYQYKPVT